MGRSSQNTPKVDALARRGDVAGLVEAARHVEVQTARDGTTGDRSAPIREAAILGLAEIGDRDALPVIAEALSDPSDRVRCAAIRALYEWEEAVPLAEAVAWLPAHGPSRALALSAIAELGDPMTAAVLTTSLVHGASQAGVWEQEAETVSALCATNGRGALAGVLDVLVEALEYKDEEVAGRAEDFLLWLGDDAAHAVKGVVRRSAKPRRAVWILGQIGGAVAVEPLIGALEHSDPRTREEACAALGDLRDPISIEPLLRATHDSEHIVRVKAAAALDSIGAVALVAALSTSSSPATRRRSRRPAENGTAAKPKNPSSLHA